MSCDILYTLQEGFLLSLKITNDLEITVYPKGSLSESTFRCKLSMIPWNSQAQPIANSNLMNHANCLEIDPN